jgi:polyhydroxyalkanoate synthesis regulator phasin
MAFTAAEEARITAIEEMINKLSIAVGNLMSKQQMRQLLLLKQTEIDTMKDEISTLKSQVTSLQSSLE